MDQVKAGSGFAATILAMVFASSAFALDAVKSVLVLHPKGGSFDDARKGIQEALGSTYVVEDFVFDKESGVGDLVKAWKGSLPKIVVAMDNKGILLAKEARDSLRDSVVPLVGLMGVRVDASLKGVPNAVGINYEIPAVTTLVNLRAILPKPIRKTGVVYRESMEDLYLRNAEFCKQEGIELVGVKVPDAADPKASLDKALKDLVGREDVDALWVLNDNFFLNARLIVGSWQPGLSGWKHPVIVGIETLVKPAFKFGTFAVLPDNYALGAQAAGLVQEIDDAGWRVEAWKVDQPLSVVKTLNKPGTKKCCGIEESKLGEVDKVLE
jgi:hypothetical protein